MTINKSAHINIGPAGWNYKDWRSIVYPHQRAKGFQELHYLADFFNLVEINSTFYKIPALESVQSWIAQVQNKKGFQFSVKLYQQFTHSDYPPEKEQVSAFCQILELFQREARLATLLVQFPWKFKKTAGNRTTLFKLMEKFKDFPCAVEFRHDSWMSDETFHTLQDRQIAFVNIDEPKHEHSLPQSTIVTSNIAYLRLHGRNSDMWFENSSTVAQRYNYLYNDAEMDSILNTIKKIREKSGNLFVIFNNHYRGQAIVNAFQLMAKLNSQPPDVPATLLQYYPQLETICRIKDDEQLSLF